MITDVRHDDRAEQTTERGALAVEPVLAAEVEAAMPSLAELARTLSPEEFAAYLEATDRDVVTHGSAPERHPELVAASIESSARTLSAIAFLVMMLAVGLGAFLLVP